MLEEALKLLKEFKDNGYKAYIVGGYVRDHILGIESSDVDITTNATPKEIMELFDEAFLSSKDYGTVTVVKKGVRFEITTFRKEINYKDNRHPDEIKYIDDLYQDLLRRDFTINTICMDENGEIIDFLKGRDDLEKRIIRTVGDAKVRFSEDALRILRAIRFATSLDFSLDKDVIESIQLNKELLKNVSYNKRRVELDKIFTSNNASKGIGLLINYKLDKALELDNLDKITNTDSLIGIWSVINSDKYPFSSNEKELIDNINKVVKMDNYDPMTLYNYGLYVNSVAGDIKGLDKKKITEEYNNLVIHSRSDLDITSEDIMKLLGREPGEYLKDIYEDIVDKILYRKLENEKEVIEEYILSKY
ncbi:MAG: CCA tRNA nucleotidyltransferase [Firmicutes bacterium]|nr:CCA tRNA nucleotidyltransferase [Bacillota bacterium]